MRAGPLALLILAAPALALPATPPAKGGWSFAHWGMSKAEVRAASGGRAHAPDADPDDPDDTVDGGATLGPFIFDSVRLEYAREGLVQINLHLAGHAGDCAKLGAYMKQTYGPKWTVEDEEGSHTLAWDDAASGNEVLWTRMDDGDDVCEVVYDPLPKR